MTSAETKRRRYQRIKRRKHRSESFDRFARLYWRYHFKVFGGHINLWSIDT